MNGRRIGTALFVVGAVFLARLGFVRAQQAPTPQNSPFLRLDPAKIMLDDRDTRVPCGECHKAEYETWLGTKHADGFNTMHRSELAQDILRDMGLRTTKRQESLCLRCHYTVKAPELSAFAGVACESCHGAARDWVKVHNDYGTGIKRREQEAPAHRQMRIQQSEAGGMLRPSGNLYAVAANCFECHTVPFEDLVNVGGHPAGSSGFELTDRVGKIRHNFLALQWGGSKDNRAPTAGRTRVMYVVGNMLDYEYSIRGMARATKADRYSKTMEKRIAKANRALETIGRSATIAEVKDILTAGRQARFGIGNSAALVALADRIRTIGSAFTRTNDGSTLGALDALISGNAAETVIAAEGASPAAALANPALAARESASAPPRASSATGAGATPAVASGTPTAGVPAPSVAVVGEVRTRPAWFPPPDTRYQTTQDAEGCASCHAVAEDWWFKDKHQGSALPLLNGDPKALDIATLYGLSANEITLGNRICMNCHGTIKTAAPNGQVIMGVSCESCHGPGSAYAKPHQDGGNPQLGMTPLKNAAARAANCSRCHHITDERLLASGHTAGRDYEFAAANTKIKHWPDDRRVGRARARRGEPAYAELSTAALTAAFQAQISGRPIPSVTVATLSRPRLAPPRSGAASGPAAAVPAQLPAARSAPRPATSTTGGEPVAPPPLPSTPRPAPKPSRVVPATERPLPALPQVGPETTTEDILLIVKRRLDLLYKSLGRGS